MLVPMQSRVLYMINNGPQRCDGKVAAEKLDQLLSYTGSNSPRYFHPAAFQQPLSQPFQFSPTETSVPDRM